MELSREKMFLSEQGKEYKERPGERNLRELVTLHQGGREHFFFIIRTRLKRGRGIKR